MVFPKRTWLILFSILTFATSAGPASAQRCPCSSFHEEVWPGESWPVAEKPEHLGWSSEKLRAAHTYSEIIGSAAVMIVEDGVVVDAWGDLDRNFQCHSMRKSLLSALIGIHAGEGRVDLSKTLAEIGIDDAPPSLTESEKQATVGDLIRARSGVYHPALGESRDMKAGRPPRHSHPPGTFWFYNNWDFNAAGTIFEQETGAGIFEDFDQRIAQPLGMADFNVENCQYLDRTTLDGRTEVPEVSVHRYYLFRMSARDLARLGLLFLRQGRWNGRQVIPAEWVKESTRAHSKTGPESGYGYMWWTGEGEGLFPNARVKGPGYYAAGYRGHVLIVLPYRNLIVVHRVDTDNSRVGLNHHQIGLLLRLILAAAGELDDVLVTADNLNDRLFSGGRREVSITQDTGSGRPQVLRIHRDGRMKIGDPAGEMDEGTWKMDGPRFRYHLEKSREEGFVFLVTDGAQAQWFAPEGIRVGEGKIVAP